MKINVCMHEESEDIELAIKTLEEKFGVDFTELYLLNSGGSYNGLTDKPSINSVILEGAMTANDLGLGSVYYDTTKNWNLQRDRIAEKAAIYIYSDYSQRVDASGNVIPIAGMKIGDGTSYLIDAPFLTDETTAIIARHISNQTIHTSRAEKEFWNNKVSAYLSSDNLENLVLSKTNYTTEGDIYNG